MKVFDPEFLKAHVDSVELRRIDRQLTLRGKHHDNLVDILEGGRCAATGHYFIVMPFIEAMRLDKVVEAAEKSHSPAPLADCGGG